MRSHTRSARLTAVAGAPGPLRAAEFFAGIGLARLGLETAGAQVVWANDVDPGKAALYRGHHGGRGDLVVGDIAAVAGGDMPDVDIAWASFPCIDLSLAGNRGGLDGAHSSTFWQFTRILAEMGDRRPPVAALENVVGFATSHAGEDLAQAIAELNRLGYSVDVLTLDARRFVPQSRPRLFLVGSRTPVDDVAEPNSELRPDWLLAPYGDPSLRVHRAALPSPPPPLTEGMTALIDADGDWWSAERVAAFTASLSPIQAERLERMRRARAITCRTAYRRTRHGVPRWEIRSDDIAGCLRTARGGSSKQAVVRAGRGRVRVRWMTPVEYARLMGAGDFALDGARTNQALFGFGDAVCVPAVHWLAEHYLLPLARGALAPAADVVSV